MQIDNDHVDVFAGDEHVGREHASDGAEHWKEGPRDHCAASRQAAPLPVPGIHRRLSPHRQVHSNSSS